MQNLNVFEWTKDDCIYLANCIYVQMPYLTNCGFFLLLIFDVFTDCTNPMYCINGGTCYEDGTNYLCACAEGYSDRNCHIVGKTSEHIINSSLNTSLRICIMNTVHVSLPCNCVYIFQRDV